MKNFFNKKILAFFIIISIIFTSINTQDINVYAAAKKVKSVTIKIGSRKVNKKIYKMTKGAKKQLKVSVKPISSKKSITYKSKNKKIVKVSKKGKLVAKKVGTTKVIIKVKGKKGKPKKTWVKIKVLRKIPPSNMTTAPPNNNDLPITTPLPDITTAPSNINLVTSTPTPEASIEALKTNTPAPESTSTPSSTIAYIGGGGGGSIGGGGSSNSTKHTPTPTTSPEESFKAPELIISDLSEKDVNNVISEKITLKGTATAYSSQIKNVSYSLKFSMEDTATITGIAEGTNNWNITELPLRTGTNFLKITATDSNKKTTSKEIILNKLSTEITLSENVILFDEDKNAEIADDIVDYWINDAGTPDDESDDMVDVLFYENSDIVKKIKNGSISPKDVIMLQPCEELYLGFNGVVISNSEPLDEKYPADSYEVISFKAADYTDIFNGDVSLSYELSDADNPLAFAYFPSEVEIYSTDNHGNRQTNLYSNIGKKDSFFSKESTSIKSSKKVGDQTPEQEIKNAGFQKNALSYMMKDALNVTGGLSSSNGMNIGIKFRDTVLFDLDGSKETKNDQFKFGGSISYNNFKVNAGIEWHPNFNPLHIDLLPQQVIGKYSYTEKVDAHAEWTGKLDLKDFVKTVNKSLNNDFENNKQFMGMTLSGVDMSDSIILGAFGLQISPAGVTPVVGIKNSQYSSIFTPLSAILVIMPVINVNGEISAKIGFTYEYSAYNEKGVNMQKKDYVGAYGSLNANKGQSSIDLPFDRSLEIYNVCSKSSDDTSSDPVWSITLKGEGKAEEEIAVGADIGLMIAGIMPTSAEVKIYEKAGVEFTGQAKVDNENGFTLDGSGNIGAKIGVMAGIHFKLAASTALFSPEIKGDKEWDKVFWEIGFTTACIDGTVLKADTDLDDTNNEKMKNISVILKRTDKLGEPTQTVTTDDEGKYKFNNVLEGKYKLLINNDVFDPYESEEFTMSNSDKTQTIYITPKAHSTLNGKVTEADSDTNTINNVPLSGVNVSISLANGLKNIQKSTITADDGTYSIEDLPVGLYNVEFTKNGYISTIQTFAINEGVTNYYNTIIEAISNEHIGKGTASGTIFDYLTGEGIENLTLNIREGVGIKTGTIVSTITSKENGKYTTDELSAGAYTVEIIDNRSDVSEKYLTNYFNIKIMGDMNIGDQNGAVGTSLISDQLRIILRWGSTPRDLDSHLRGPKSDNGTFHIYYSHKRYYENGIKIADLDLDDTSSWGPETTTIYNPIPGTYKFYVHDFSNKYDENNTELANSGAIVQIYRGISAVPEYELYVPQGVGTVWNVFEYNSETGDINIINTLAHESNSSNVGLIPLPDNTDVDDYNK